ncbi:MAG: hypothetical protein LBG58_13720 [Planctomycetaceae bacterium]|jgi:hypothetical protein|nr:hypothetical protein [Planctomycetaceae bacterium]
MINFIEHYFRKRIDDALDDAQPLDGWTAWYVRRSPKLWEYYTEMLELELELRFPNTELPNNNSVKNLVLSNNLNNRPRSWFKNRVWISAAAAVILAFLTVFSLFHFLKPQQSSERHGIDIVSNNSDKPAEEQKPIEEQKLTEEQKIDLGDIWGELSFTATPLTELVPPIENPFDNSLLNFPVEPIVRFTDHPLKSTLTFLETAGIIRSSNHERD